jgi:hypothetical protein
MALNQASYKSSFDPHYWEKCYVFRCKKNECPYVEPCFGAQRRDQEKTKNFIEEMNGKISQGIDLEKLNTVEKINFYHSIKKHGAKYSEKDIRFFCSGVNNSKE